jgi:hypothetical protein
MHRGPLAAVGGLALAALLAFALFKLVGGDEEDVPAARPIEQDGLRLIARVQDGGVQVATDGRFQPRFWRGVNLGVTVPGHHPGELAPSRADYDRWLDGMGRLGVGVVRVYTILRPQFYEALDAHNRRHPDAPLYFIQGIWIPEEEFLAAKDAYAVSDGFDDEIADAVAVVHGDAELPERPGHASGRYTADVSRWLLAWSPGVEWDPDAVHATDRRHRDAPLPPGRYIVASEEATPMERWIAARLDHLAGREAERGWSRPVTFTNWLTTDPLEHPREPLPKEDLVSVDAAQIGATDRWPGGFFASYHAYPYYPDFLRLQYRDAPDPYAAYLRELKAHHGDQAVMVTEFGVPTGIGAAHRGPLGRDQGDHSEQEAAKMNADMLGIIEREDYAGGVLFSWTDEWFKRTWNTMDVELAEGRPLWPNALTNEEQFGVIAVDPEERPPVTVDGRDDEWGDGRVEHDSGYLYLLLRDRPPGPTTLDFDVRPRPGPDVKLTLGPGRRAQLVIATETDPIQMLYALARDYVPVERGPWVTQRLILNRPYRVPGTSEVRPTELMDVGRLRWGTADPDAPDYDGRVTVAGDEAVTELRIPWALLTFSDPSKHMVWEPHPDGTVDALRVGALKISLPGETLEYDWDDWTAVAWHERRKAGWDTLARAFRR